jgi:hypothetical protein
VEEEILKRVLERIAESTDVGMDCESYLKTVNCEDALAMVCDCLQNVFWPSSFNLKQLPKSATGRAHITPIPWVATQVLHEQRTEQSRSGRPVWRGAFIPRLPVENRNDDPTTAATTNEQVVTASKES